VAKKLDIKSLPVTGSTVPSYKYGAREGADTASQCASLDSCLNYTEKRETLKYTGTLVIGIAQTHKSNAVPVIDQQQIIDIARMRR
jgi:hypothetical protein